MLTHRALLAAAVLMCLASCSGAGDNDDQRPSPSPVAVESLTSAGAAAVVPALPPGALVELVPTSAELPAGFAPVEGGAGPLDLAGLAELSTSPEAAAAALEGERYRDGYSAQFASEDGGSFVSVVVARFRDADGARAHFAREQRESTTGTTPVSIAAVGDESFAFTEKLAEADIGEIAAIIFRVGDLVWLVETSGQSTGDLALAQSVATTLSKRIS